MENINQIVLKLPNRKRGISKNEGIEVNDNEI